MSRNPAGRMWIIAALVVGLTFAPTAAPALAQDPESNDNPPDNDEADSRDPSGGEQEQDRDDQGEQDQVDEQEETTDLEIIVRDKASRDRVKGAEVFVMPIESGRFSEIVDVTDSTGTVKVANIPLCEIRIVVSASGMESFGKKFELTESDRDPQVISIELAPEEEDEPDPDETD